MSRRAGIVGLVVSTLALLLTLVVITGVGPSVPGPPIRSWLGVGDPDSSEPCVFDPAKVRDPGGRAAPGAWRPEPGSPNSAPELGAARLGDYIYLVGGQHPSRGILRFDPRDGRYRRVAELPFAIDHPVVAAHGGEVISAGGYIEGADATNRVWAYSPRTGEVRELPPMRQSRAAAAGAVIGDRLYVAGGLFRFGNEHPPHRSLEIYDFDRRRWTRGPDMPTARHHFGAAALGGDLYFAGGRQPGDLSLSRFEAFDPATNRWRRLPPLPTGTGSLGVASAAGRVVATGGGDEGYHPGQEEWVLRTAYAYDPRTRRWTRLPDMSRPRHGHASATAGGRVYVFRGVPCPGYGRMASVESLELR